MDGKGAATITDMTVDLVHNKEVYEDIYPSENDDDDISDNESDDGLFEVESGEKTRLEQEQRRFQKEINRNDAQRTAAQDTVINAQLLHQISRT